MITILKNLGFEGEKTLIVLPEKNDSVMFSARNIPGVTVRRVSELNPYEIAVNRRILMTKEAVERLAEAGDK